ncbi:MAG: hypothetical protein LJF04_19505, partial [Gemmatimonadetes bacterium]|nr:hypothetical protein [Gemmatimonadota bacterium]
LVRLGERYPDLKLVATHMDEVFNRGRLPLYIYLTKVVRLVPGLPMYITLQNRPGRGVSRMLSQIDPWVDIRGYNGHSMDAWLQAGHDFGELAGDLTKSGDEGWIYYNVRGSFFLAEWTWLVNSYYLWMSPLKAHTPWRYYNVHGNPLDDTDGPRIRGHDRGYAVPSPEDGKTIIPTRQWEAYREGIEDLRYLSLLDSLLDVARSRTPPAASSAEKWLEQLRGNLPRLPQDLAGIRGESPVLRWFSARYRGADYQSWRRRTADEIVKLMEACCSEDLIRGGAVERRQSLSPTRG